MLAPTEHVVAEDTLFGLRPNKVAHLGRSRKARAITPRVLRHLSEPSRKFHAGLLALMTIPTQSMFEVYSIHKHEPWAVSTGLGA